MRTLQFVSYPVALPQHGGQLRVSAMKKALSEAGVEAMSISFFDASHYQNYDSGDFAIPTGRFAYYQKDHPWDLMLSAVVNNDPELRPRVVEAIRAANADVYIFDQPWLWPLVREIVRKFPELKRPVVMSTQNVEFDLLRGILRGKGRDLSEHDEWLLNYSYNLEKELAEEAEIVVACTQGDMDLLASQFKIKKGVVFPNGINPPAKVPGSIQDDIAKRYANVQLAGFVGSAHPPNAEGFETMFGDNLGYLAPDQKIAVIGGVCDLIYSKTRENLFVALNDSRCDYLGRVTQERLDGVLARSKVILLPILTGGGSNLKTAEALVSGKTILATSLAFRGYDGFRDFPTVNITDDPVAMRLKLRELLSAESLPVLTEAQKDRTRMLLWENILKDYPDHIKAIMN